MIQLVYTSTARFLFGKTEIDDILRTSREKNVLHNITGVLLYKSGSIVQAIEGDDDAVFRLYANIQRDVRHKSVTLIYAQPIANREFPHWSMGFNQVETGCEAPPNGFNPMLAVDSLPAVVAGRASLVLHMFAVSTR